MVQGLGLIKTQFLKFSENNFNFFRRFDMIVTHFVHNFTRWLHVRVNITAYLHCRSYTNLLAPHVHKMGLKADICNPEVSVPPPLRLQGLDDRTLRYGDQTSSFRCTPTRWTGLQECGTLDSKQKPEYAIPMF